jgi:hypothetical protein
MSCSRRHFLPFSEGTRERTCRNEFQCFFHFFPQKRLSNHNYFLKLLQDLSTSFLQSSILQTQSTTNSRTMASTVRQRLRRPFQQHIDREEAIAGSASETIDTQDTAQERHRMCHSVVVHMIALCYLFGPWPRSTAICIMRRYLISKITSHYQFEVLMTLGIILWLAPYMFLDIKGSVLRRFCYLVMALMTAAGLILIRSQSLVTFTIEKWLWIFIMADIVMYVKRKGIYKG